jgi:hypothetical protein
MAQSLALMLLIAAPWATQDGDPIDRLITDLADESAAVRESAQLALIASGPKAIPRLRQALTSQDAEVQERASSALCDLEREQKLAAVMPSRPPVTLTLENATFAQALQEVGRRTGIGFEGAVQLPGRPITLILTRAPLMQVLDALGAAAELQWVFESETSVSWRRTPQTPRPSCYSGGFRVSLSRIDVYKSWNYREEHGLLWANFEIRAEPGIHPLGMPRLEVSEIRDDSGNELPRNSEIQECFPKASSQDSSAVRAGAIYESSPLTVNHLARSVKKLSKIGGRAVFLFPLDKTSLEMTDLCEESSVTRGELEFQVSEILTSSLKLSVVTSGNLNYLYHHLDAESLILIDAEGKEHVRGADFGLRVEQLNLDTLRYCVDFNEGVCFQPIALRFMMNGRFFEKIVPFEFKDVPLP